MGSKADVLDLSEGVFMFLLAIFQHLTTSQTGNLENASLSVTEFTVVSVSQSYIHRIGTVDWW